ncbi:DUF732 domain-containing protein [Mycobacterium avium subsp. paratuberculosis]|nr:hypothetical protein O982_09510 [Mycobacterium avium 10-5581]ETB03351.1 hypothetical protein O979_09510 [Mycobacterium avium subsp. paratuberculosis 10-4404]ETB04687.1 hypothetical protein O978_09565 [Mycobacterium avium subsp. paratuberculosis 10-5864]ETB12347.1 hypothetical protein O980_09305 [Mycobacterium avium subsp. paratuberculosis 08-8281]ETB30453.1 hypothetical protein O971_09675 [Mycobacterium avium subsp. hominissuis 10-4249]ETB33053.1 hypothetical protein O977_10175 [Mycobacteri
MARTRAQGAGLAVGTAGIMLGAAVFGGAVLSAPPAAAACSLTPADDQYINLLAQNKMVHNADFSDCHEAAEGRWFADQVRSNPNPYGKAKELVNMVTNTTPLSPDQAEWEVESAIYVYAPDLIPKIKAQAGQPAPPAA